MPKIIHSDDMQEASGDGWIVRTVADASHIGFPAMVAKWWIFTAGQPGPEQTQGSDAELLYVIRGSGQAIVDGKVFELDDESVLWLEEGEVYHFVAGNNGLEILQGYARGESNG